MSDAKRARREHSWLVDAPPRRRRTANKPWGSVSPSARRRSSLGRDRATPAEVRAGGRTERMTSTPFHDLDQYVAIPRLSGLVLSPDGTRLVTAVATLNSKKTKFVTALWEVDPSQPGARATADPQREGRVQRRVHARRRPAVHQRAAGPGQRQGRRRRGPRAVAAAAGTAPRRGSSRDRAAGLGGVRVAKDADVVLVGSDVLPQRHGRRDGREAAQGPQGQEGRGDPARLVPGPVLGPRPRPGVAAPVRRDRVGDDVVAPLASSTDPRLTLTDVTPDARSALVEQASDDQPGRPDGGHRLARAAGARASSAAGSSRSTSRPGEHRVLVDDPTADLWVAASSRRTGSGSRTRRETISTPHEAPRGDARGRPAGGRRAAHARADRGTAGRTSPVWLPDSSGAAGARRRRRPRTDLPDRPRDATRSRG